MESSFALCRHFRRTHFGFYRTVDVATTEHFATHCGTVIPFVDLWWACLIWTLPAGQAKRGALGHMQQLLLSGRYGDHEFRWQKMFGPVYRMKGCFGQDRLMVADPLALQTILNSPLFVRTGMFDILMRLLFGEESVICTEGRFRHGDITRSKLSVDVGDKHRRIRAAMNSGFTAAAVRTYKAVFEKVAETLSEQLENSPAGSINICPLLSLATLNAISEAVLRYSTQDLGEDFVANNVQVVKVSGTQSGTQILVEALSAGFPMWLWRAGMALPTTTFKIFRKLRYLTDQLARRIIRERRDAATQGLEMNDDYFSDLLASDNMGEDEIIAQVGILLVAGQETTANTIAFALLELARHPDFQEKLRDEIHSALGTSQGAGPYDSMPLLNALIKEITRLYPALPLADRVALQDTIIPLAEAITTSTGEQITQIPILKGQFVTLAIASYQRLEPRWGKDVHEFNPSRWLDGTVSAGDAVGPYANLLSFLGGPHTCLGWRFAILEIQVILCQLVSKFSFAQAEGESIKPRFLNNLMPVVSSGEKAVPLHITRL
ncbi:Cytochrome P450 [Mycena venus]|uniref:Cytochrome P450 n=1 Tax=Mycena venus TaxID=2733690 RepID=A0A8H6X6L8_9AGAR|nr:Cytochrome P450 [Mycena venus]